MRGFIFCYVAVLATLVAGDAAWLSYFAPVMFRPTLGNILLGDPRWLAVVAFYLIYALGIIVFPIKLASQKNSWSGAFAYGAFFGFLAYMTYDLTNLATIKVWTISLASIDVAWGGMLTSIASAAGYTILRATRISS